ncbi:glycosyltransferase family 2 protein [Candidatus Saccharibacteria bacterium]|nr:glycosyltransferase family 2 protein [Candidatus Saccharibacteria bacterium]
MRLSVVIPVYNEAGQIEDCLASLRAQTRPADEIIVVDNNCSDDTADRARRFGAHIVTQPVQGIWPARAAGFAAARGELLIGTDADARFPPDWLAKIEQLARKRPDAVAFSGPGRFYDGGRLHNRLADFWYMSAYFKLVGAALMTPPIFGSNFALRAEAWRAVRETVHLDVPEIHDDIDLSYHLLPLGAIVHDHGMANFISIRPLRSMRQMMRRYRRGFRSIFLHWPQQAPWRLYMERRSRRPRG